MIFRKQHFTPQIVQLKTIMTEKITFILLLCLFFQLIIRLRRTTLPKFPFWQEQSYQNRKVIRCASTEYEEYLKSKTPIDCQILNLNNGLPKNCFEKERRKNAPKGSRVNAVITIPVVVHVIHNGDLIGTDENIFTNTFANTSLKRF
jgi:hypothetical protein